MNDKTTTTMTQTTHSHMKRCVDCGKRVASPITGARSADYGVLVRDDEAICVMCYEHRKKMAEIQIPMFENRKRSKEVA